MEEKKLDTQSPINQEATLKLSGFPSNDDKIKGWNVQPLRLPTVVSEQCHLLLIELSAIFLI